MALLRILLATVFVALWPSPERSPAQTPGATSPVNPSETFDPTLLNIRMQSRRLEPPREVVRETWILEGYRLGRLGAQEPRAAIIDDDNRRRLLILSASEEGQVRLYRVAEIPVDVGRRLGAAVNCARSRQCQRQRMDPAGELGCLALCLLESLKE